MQLSTRYGLLGIGALALLTTVHQVRERIILSSPEGHFLLGTLPNFAAAIAITFVLLSIWTEQNPAAALVAIRRAFLICASISAVGLVAWEAIQKSSTRFVFDLNDVGATVVGVLAAGLLSWIVTPPTRPTT